MAASRSYNEAVSGLPPREEYVMVRLLVSVLSVVIPVTAFAQTKKRVAVMNFDYATVHSTVAAIFGSNVDIG